MKYKPRALIKISLIIVVITAAVISVRARYVIPVLMYHHVAPAEKTDKLSVSPESFKRQIEFLINKDYNIISLNQVIDLMKNKQTRHGKNVAITFDDGYADLYKNAYPVLKKHNLSATIFLIVDFIGKKGYLNWDEILEMAEHGITFGSHTMTHPELPDLSDEKIRREVIYSKSLLENRLKKPIDFIAYPLGAFNQKVVSIVQRAGYLGACATNPGKRFSSRHPYFIKRLRISATGDNLLVFWFQCSGYYTWIKEIRKK
ncbi:MAG: polysaccharide deacetylase family protein [Candidatus Omnitrophota bacterium]